MKNKLKTILLLSLFSFALVSCGEGGATLDTEASTNNPTTDDPTEVPSLEPSSQPTEDIPFPEAGANYYKHHDYETTFNLEKVLAGGRLQTLPSEGEANILVVPVEFSDLDPFHFSTLDAMEIAFNGSNPDGTNDYWESVSSFYYKSSYGRLNLHFDICDIFKPSISSDTFKQLEINNGNGAAKGTKVLLKEMYDNIYLYGNKVNYEDYDVNNDKAVDGIWLLYNEIDPNLKNDYWPYVYWANSDGWGDKFKTPHFGPYANCAAGFMYYASQLGHDAHTLIHETGHMMGLKDYYTTEPGKQSPCGGYDMMDANLGDHCAYSKFSLGWLEPYVVTGSTKIELKPLNKTNEAIIIPNYWNDSAFGEYFIIEYYRPEGLNEIDGNNIYPGRNVSHYSEPGIRMFYVDSRIMEFRDFDMSIADYRHFAWLDEKATSFAPRTYYSIGNDNNQKKSLSRKYFQSSHNMFQIAYVCDGLPDSLYNTRDTFHLWDDQTHLGKNSTMFQEGEKFDPSDFFLLFENKKTQAGFDINFTFEVESLSESKAVININFN